MSLAFLLRSELLCPEHEKLLDVWPITYLQALLQSQVPKNESFDDTMKPTTYQIELLI
jgi:hypothetical protein